MIVVFDENLPPKMAEILTSLIGEEYDCQIKSVKSMNCLGMSDVELFETLGKCSNSDDKCVLITADKNINRRAAEIQALKSNGLIAFFLPPKMAQKRMWDKAVYLMVSWNAIYEKAMKAKPRTVFQLPARRGTYVTENEIKKM